MFGLSLSTPSIFAILGCLLIAWDMSKKNKNPWTVVAGLAFLGLTGFMRLVSGVGVFSILSGAFTDLGIGLWTSAGYLVLRKGKAKPFFVLGFMALALAVALSFLTRLSGDQQPAQSFLFELGPDDRIEEVMPVLERYDAQIERAFPTISLNMDEDLAQVYLVTASAENSSVLMETLRSDAENVDYVAWNEAVSLLPPVESVAPQKHPRHPIVANDPLAESQWALDAINAAESHKILRNHQPARKARVAILDTGVDGVHEDLDGIFEQSPANVDKHGHGTHCAGIAGAATNNELGMASLNWNGEYIEIMGYQALGADGIGSLESIAQSIIDATNDNADVISMSLGGFSLTPPQVVKDAVEYALRNGAIVVAAAGNSNQDARNHMPSNVEGVITVSAVDQNLNKAKFSNTNMGLTRPIAAPGVDIVSLVPNNEYGPKSGTSMATPLVSGLLGVMRALNPELSAKRAYEILHDTGVKVNDSNKVGLVIDAEAAIKSVLEVNTPS